MLLDKVISLQKYALVGIWYFSDLLEEEMRDWVESKWKTLLDYAPMVSKLVNSWYNFHFLCQEDLEKILRLHGCAGVGSYHYTHGI